MLTPPGEGLSNNGKLAFDYRTIMQNDGQYDRASVCWSDPFAIIFTSGTTGPSKGALLPHNYALLMDEVIMSSAQYTEKDRLYNALPLFHGNAQFLSTMPALMSGAQMVLAGRFSASNFWSDVKRYGCTEFNYIGGILPLLLKAEPKPEDADHPLRVMMGGGCTKDISEAIEKRFGTSVLEGYGMSEIGMPLMNSLDARKPGSVGRPAFGCEVKLVDDMEQDVSAGDVGEILPRPSVPYGMFLQYYKMPEQTVEAWRLAIQDAAIVPERVEFAIFACAFGMRLFGEMTTGQNVFWDVGISRIPVINVENACTSGSSGFVLAYQTIAAGQADVALVVGAEKLNVPGTGLLNSGETELDTQLGNVTPAGFAMRARRHMQKYGTTVEQLAAVAVKNRRHAVHNPYAHFREAVTLTEVLSSPVVADPLTRLQCCPVSDGAAAVVLGSAHAAQNSPRRIPVRTALLCSGSYENPPDMDRWETDYRGCQAAYEKAAIGPQDVDVIECHDAFTIAEVLHYEALGLCSPGEGGDLAARGETALGGRIPVNVSGGLIGRGHPPGATGIAQICEITTQLRGEAGHRQVARARVGLAHCMGGDKDGDTKSCTVVILAK